MFTQADYDRLKQIMEESPEKKELLTRLLESHKMEISSLSHEIRNPLTLIYSTLQLIESSHPEVLGFHYWDSLCQDVEYMNQLIMELSLYNNCERIRREQIHTEDFLKKTALSFAASVSDTNIEFTSRIAPGIPSISGDCVKLRQVLLNLLSNAKDATDGHPHPKISLHADTQDHSFIVRIRDNGCGIEPAVIEQIFEPFATYKKNGTGLGLPIARRIALAHCGSLTVSSKPGDGAVFTLTLPV